MIRECRDLNEKKRLLAISDPEDQASTLLFLSLYRPTLFSDFKHLYQERYERKPCLDLPFREEDYSGVYYPQSGSPKF
jgi:hypothetical protein